MSSIGFAAQKFAARRLLALALMACRVGQIFLPDEESKKRMRMLVSEFSGKFKGAISKASNLDELKENIANVGDEVEARLDELEREENEQRNK